MDRLPNIVFILTDQMRGDSMSCVDHPVVETPALDELAARGALFDRAYAACPSCIAARAALWTGKTPNTVGRIGYRDCVPWTYETTLMTELAKAGYQNHCQGKTHFYPQRTLMGFHSLESYEANQNFEGDYINDYREWLSRQPGAPPHERFNGQDCNTWITYPWTYADHLHLNSWTVTRSIEFIKRRDPAKPFFLNVSFHRPHPPVDPPEFFFHMYDDIELPEVPVADWALEWDTDVSIMDQSHGRLPKRQLDRYRRGYWGMISHIDAQIARLMLYLKRNQLWNNTIFVFTSDHGELLGDHLLLRKCHAFEGSAKIPFIVSAPGMEELPAGIRSRVSISHMDMMPTILDMVGLPVPGDIEGRSALGILKGEDIEWRKYTHGEHSGIYDLSQHGGVQFIVGSRHKYIWYTKSGWELLFDIDNDPQEIHNLAEDPEYAETKREMRGELFKILDARPQDGLTGGKDLKPGRALPAVRDELLKPYYDAQGIPRPAKKTSLYDLCEDE